MNKIFSLYGKTLLCALFLINGATSKASLRSYLPTLPAQELRWNWSLIDTSYEALLLSFKEYSEALVIKFNTPFKWGGASSAYQVEGTQSVDGKHCENNWTAWSAKHGRVSAGISCDHWKHYKEDVQLIKQLGMNAYRFSIEWSKIQPQPGVFDHKAMKHYISLVDELIKNGIEPIVCLWHHTWPIWFDKKDAFEKEENIKDFVEYTSYVFKKLKGKVRTWVTFNEPEGYALEGYFRGHCPPEKKSLPLAGNVLFNFLKAHVEVYKLFKHIDPSVQIGLIKVMNPIEPYHAYNPIEHLAAKVFDYLLNDAMLDFFKTGTFAWKVLGYNIVQGQIDDAPNCLDYIGISYYTHTLLKQSFKGKIATGIRPGQQVSDSNKALYPEGLYRSIQKAATVGKPLCIAENGLSDQADWLRDEYIRKHLYVVSKALQEGYDIRGFFYWSPTDTYNWLSDFNSKYGLYAVDFASPDKTRSLRPSAEKFSDFIKATRQIA